MARNPIDPFDDPFDSWDDNTASPRKAGRPSTRRTPAKGPNGRPRIRPLQDKYSRKRGRPALSSGSVADKIEKEVLISGGYFDKGVITSVKGLEKSVSTFQTKVINPLAKSVNSFANSVSRFNAYHQQYLKDQLAVSKEIHETFKLFRKTSIDPLLRNTARTRRGTRALYSTLKEVSDSGYTKKEFREFVNVVGEIDDKLDKALKAGVIATEVSDSILKEYYRTTKGTSKFLNSVAFATEDIAEDINALRDNMARYFKGKHNVSVLQDHTEALRKIEKNTAAPTVGKRILSSITAAVVAMGKTAFKYNRFGTTQLIAQLTGYKMPNLESMNSDTIVGKVGKTLADAYDVAIRQKVRDAQGNLQYTYRSMETGMYGPVAQAGAEQLGKVGRSYNSMVQAIRKAWDESKTKEWAKYFWSVGESFLIRFWDQYGAQGERSINTVITNYSSKDGRPHRGEHITDIAEDIERIVKKAQSGKYKRVNGKLLRGPWNNKSTAEDIWDGDDLSFSNARARAPEKGGYKFSRVHGSSALKDSSYSPFTVSKAQSAISKAKGGSNVIQGPWGFGSGIVTFESKSEQDMNSADVSTPKKAFASLAKLQGRAVGYLKKIWSKTKSSGEGIDKGNKEGGLLEKVVAAAGLGWLGKTLLKNRKLLKGSEGGLSALGKVIFGAHAIKKGFAGSRIIGKHAKASGFGSTARVLWDTFGWGSAKNKGHMGAIGAFKNTRLGQSSLGTWIRKAALASAGRGTDLGSRLLGGLIHAGKWGGLDPLGIGAGLYHGLGVKIGKEGISLAGRKSLASLGGVADKAGTRTRAVLNAKKAAKFAEANPLIAKVLGTGTIGHIGSAIAAPAKGLGKLMTKIPSKDKVIGGLLGGVGVKALSKMGGKGVAKALAKQIPILGAIVGIGFGINRFTKGDVLGGILEIVSGLLTLVPSGAGNVAALGIDAFLIGRDIHKKNLNKKNKKQELEKEKVTEAFGLGPNPSATEVVGAAKIAAENARSSDVNHVSVAQKTEGEAGYISSSGSSDPKPVNRGFFGSIGNAFSRAGTAISNWSDSTLGTGGAGGEKVWTNKDNGSINWNGKRHDKLMPKFQKALYSAADEFYKQTGKKVQINSAIRTDEEQANLWYRANILNDPRVYKPARPVYDHNINGKLVKGTGNNYRTGHLVGGAVDVNNWREFKPYAIKYGLHWMGSSDPVHFQTNEKGPAITSASAKQIDRPTQSGYISSTRSVGDGDSYMTRPYSPMQSVGSGSNTPNAAPSVQTEISPMIQDYGLAIINNMLFA